MLSPIEIMLNVLFVVGGCTWSQLKSCPPGKEFIATHRGKIGSISENKASQPPNSVTTSASETSQQQISHHYIKRDSNSKFKKSPNSIQIEDLASSGEPTDFRPIRPAPLAPPPPYHVKRESIMGIKLYSVSDSPPTLAVRMALKYLDIEYELINVDFGAGEQISPAFVEKNPQGEVPLLEDNEFMLSESVAILQYLAEKYKKDESFYPTDPQQRALVNHTLAFHLSTLYRSIFSYMILPLCYAYHRTEENLKKLLHALKVFEEFLKRRNTEFVAGANLTIADLPMVMDLVCLEAMSDFEMTLSPFPRIKTWYDGFKTKYPDLWALANQGLEELTAFEKNPPDLSHIKHPIHPTDKTKLK